MQHLVDFVQGMDFGEGVNSASGYIRSSAVSGNEPPRTSGGKEVTLILSLAESTQDLEKTFSISSETDISYGAFSASANIDFVKSCELHKYSVWVAIKVTALFDMRNLPEPKLKAEVKEYFASHGVERFIEQYGDRFVAGIQEGASLFVILEIETSSETDKENLTSTIKASGTVGSFSGSSTLTISSKFQQTIASRKVNLKMKVRGGEVPSSIEPITLIQQGLDFANKVTSGNCVKIAAFLQDYEALGLDLPSGQRSPTSVIDDLIKNCTKLEQDYNNISALHSASKYVLDHPEQFDGTLDDLRNRYSSYFSVLDNAKKELNSALADYQKKISTSESSLSVTVPITPQIPSVSLPERLHDSAYYIRSKAKDAQGNALVLTMEPWDVNLGGLAIRFYLSKVRRLDENRPDQKWIMHHDEGNVTFRNGQHKKILVATGARQAPFLPLLFPPDSLGGIPDSVAQGLQGDKLQVTTFTIAGSMPYAIRPSANSDFNFNVLGDSYFDGCTVGLCGWGGGNDNENWYFDQVYSLMGLDFTS